MSSPDFGLGIDDEANDKAGHYQSSVQNREAIQLWEEPMAEPRNSEAN